MHFNHDSGLSPLQCITLCQRIWHHSWLIVRGANHFNGYCFFQPLSTPGTGSLNYFACPSASYHAIPCLCIILMIIVSFWSFSTQNLQEWMLATIVDFATHFTSSTFVLTTFWEYLIFPTQHEANILNFNSSDLSLDCTFAKVTRIHKTMPG